MEKSEAINELAAALAKAQGAMRGAKKDADNPFFKSKYADLASCWDAIREPFTANGLSVIQLTEPTVDVITVETILAHSSGQWISSKIAMKPVKADPQSVGSCLTYARRYSLAAATGIAPEDDDGNTASGKQALSVDYIDDKQKSTIIDFINDKQIDVNKFLAFMKCESIETIPASEFNKAVASLKAAKGKAA